VLNADRSSLAVTTEPQQDSPDLAFVTVTVVDRAGNPCPDAAVPLSFKTSGSVRYKAACNGDATSLESFTAPRMTTFGGQLVVVVQATTVSGRGQLTVSGRGVRSGSVSFEVGSAQR
jgi:beta-galactosidase